MNKKEKKGKEESSKWLTAEQVAAVTSFKVKTVQGWLDKLLERKSRAVRLDQGRATIRLRAWNREVERKILKKIGVEAARVRWSLRGFSMDAKDIMQELKLTAMEAERGYWELKDKQANRLTFVKKAIWNHAQTLINRHDRDLNVASCISNSPKTIENFAKERGEYERNSQRCDDIRDDFNDVNYPDVKKRKRIKNKHCGVSLGFNMKYVARTRPEYDHKPRIVVRAVIKKLEPRQRKICQLVMRGKSLREIGDHFCVKPQTIHEQLEKLQPKFIKIGKLYFSHLMIPAFCH